MKNNSIKLGLIIVIFCGMIWGFGGVLGQILFQNSNMSPALLSSVRMLVAGMILTIYSLMRRGKEALRILHSGKDTIKFLGFAMFGVMAMQYSYFAAVEASNAATGTVLQYTYPAFILVFSAIKNRKLPRTYETIAILSALAGVFVVATHCNMANLHLSFASVFWGMVAALSYVIYTIAPGKLYEKYGLVNVVGLGMLLGGIVLSLLTRCWQKPVEVTMLVVSITCFITVFCSLTPMVLYGKGVKILGSVRASLYVTVEPVFCAIVSVLMGLTILDKMDILGFILILVPIEFVAYQGRKENEKK